MIRQRPASELAAPSAEGVIFLRVRRLTMGRARRQGDVAAREGRWTCPLAGAVAAGLEAAAAAAEPAAAAAAPPPPPPALSLRSATPAQFSAALTPFSAALAPRFLPLLTASAFRPPASLRAASDAPPTASFGASSVGPLTAIYDDCPAVGGKIAALLRAAQRSSAADPPPTPQPGPPPLPAVARLRGIAAGWKRLEYAAAESDRATMLERVFEQYRRTVEGVDDVVPDGAGGSAGPPGLRLFVRSVLFGGVTLFDLALLLWQHAELAKAPSRAALEAGMRASWREAARFVAGSQRAHGERFPAGDALELRPPLQLELLTSNLRSLAVAQEDAAEALARGRPWADPPFAGPTGPAEMRNRTVELREALVAEFRRCRGALLANIDALCEALAAADRAADDGADAAATGTDAAATGTDAAAFFSWEKRF